MFYEEIKVKSFEKDLIQARKVWFNADGDLHSSAVGKQNANSVAVLSQP